MDPAVCSVIMMVIRWTSDPEDQNTASPRFVNLEGPDKGMLRSTTPKGGGKAFVNK